MILWLQRVAIVLELLSFFLVAPEIITEIRKDDGALLRRIRQQWYRILALILALMGIAKEIFKATFPLLMGVYLCIFIWLLTRHIAPFLSSFLDPLFDRLLTIWGYPFQLLDHVNLDMPLNRLLLLVVAGSLGVASITSARFRTVLFATIRLVFFAYASVPFLFIIWGYGVIPWIILFLPIIAFVWTLGKLMEWSADDARWRRSLLFAGLLCFVLSQALQIYVTFLP